MRELTTRMAGRGIEIEIFTVGSKSRTGVEREGLVTTHRFGSPMTAQFVSPIFLRGLTQPGVVIDDLAHVVPWFSTHFTSDPVILYFRHLHRRTLPYQLPLPLSRGLTWLESNYAAIYGDVQIVAESSDALLDLHQLGFTKDNVNLIPPGVDTKMFRPGSRAPTPEIVYFGGFQGHKRPEHVLEVARRLADRNIPFHLTVVGHGVRLPALVELARRLRITRLVDFVGRVSDEKLRELVSKAWVNIHCAVAEGWCLSVMEAAACGVPTVAYNVPGLRDSVREGRTGILVADGVLEQLAEAVASILDRPNGWEEPCVSHARRLSWDVTTESWVTLLG